VPQSSNATRKVEGRESKVGGWGNLRKVPKSSLELRLIRMRIGTLELRDLPPGAWRELTPVERKLVLD
jgi:hypothetical protein